MVSSRLKGLITAASTLFHRSCHYNLSSVSVLRKVLNEEKIDLVDLLETATGLNKYSLWTNISVGAECDNTPRIS